MTPYTTFFNQQSYNILNEDDFTEALKQCAKAFRTFDKAMDTFIVDHGYNEDINDIECKILFIKEKFKAAGIQTPRNLRRWYTDHIMIERKTVFQICFAFALGIEETNDFMRRICLMRGIDCHNMEEIVYYFALENGMDYQQAESVIKSINMVKPDKNIQPDPVYTEVIANDVEAISSKEELIEYLSENAQQFEYNSASAYKRIQVLWNEIAGNSGIAIREKKKIYPKFNDEDTEQPRVRHEDSIWEICLQMLGLAGSYSDIYYSDRSLKSILKDNELLHPLAEASFPDRDGLNKVLLGRHVSYEKVRKLLILLGFYKFWGEKALLSNNYNSEKSDVERCISTLNEYLVDSGYPTLYPGNPYDFIFLTSINSDCPLYIFRCIMREIYFEKADMY